MTGALVAGGGGLLVLGLPIYLVLGVTAALLLASTGAPMISVTQKIVDELNSQTLIAVPFFVVAATFMERGGVAKALIDAALTWVGRVRGGLGIVCVIACTIFAAMCGSSVATALAMGTILVPAMLREGYARPFAAGIVGSSGTLGILIPPSLAMVVYGVLSDESVPRLFLAGVIPGLIQAALISGWIVFYARRKGYRRSETPMARGDFLATNLRALPALSIPIIVLGGIYGGVATVTEAAALSAVAAILVSLVFYRSITIKGVIPLIALATRNAATIMIIIVTALIFGHWVTESGATAAIVDFARQQQLSPAAFLAFVTVLFFVLGMFLEVFSVLLIALPVLLPLLPEFGIDPIQFGVIVTINMELALLTPPVGLNLFVLSSITKAPMAEVIRGIVPFVVLIALLLLAVMVVPQLSLWLPTLVLG
ncbi:TRAP transporter large permease [Acuticoccus sediminis]|uniref:TRAP transporter large permease protein n=1 Tax=Acuticoccus sediminis TaxID=2184697 RepID=A0A8B2NYS0_9HYPH|nr:TRAP transporter large permease subunit [Acuticoccus sediminis]RAI01740.1 TRAP transporter large permease [Acuticoccus sediminis]